MHVILRREVMIENCVDVFKSVSSGEVVGLGQLRVWSVEMTTTTTSDSDRKNGLRREEGSLSERSC
jgi:hypothetical protein